MREATVSTLLVTLFALPLGWAFGCKKEPPPAPPAAPSCRDACGEGMRFAETKCVIDWNAGVCVPPEKLEELTNRYEDWTQCPVDPGTMPPFRRIDVRKIPKHDPSKTRTQSFSGGTEQLDEHAIEQHFKQFEELVYDCLTVAACYAGGHPGTGDLTFSLGVEPDGTINGINVKASKNLRKWGVDRCAKKALYEYGFATYDGETENIEYEMQIEGPVEPIDS